MVDAGKPRSGRAKAAKGRAARRLLMTHSSTTSALESERCPRAPNNHLARMRDPRDRVRACVTCRFSDQTRPRTSRRSPRALFKPSTDARPALRARPSRWRSGDGSQPSLPAMPCPRRVSEVARSNILRKRSPRQLRAGHRESCPLGPQTISCSCGPSSCHASHCWLGSTCRRLPSANANPRTASAVTLARAILL